MISLAVETRTIYVQKIHEQNRVLNWDKRFASLLSFMLLAQLDPIGSLKRAYVSCSGISRDLMLSSND